MNDGILQAIIAALAGVVDGECIGYWLQFRQEDGGIHSCSGGAVAERFFELEALLELAQRRANNAEETIRQIEPLTKEVDYSNIYDNMAGIADAVSMHRERKP
jgi:hypothetical protein